MKNPSYRLAHLAAPLVLFATLGTTLAPTPGLAAEGASPMLADPDEDPGLVEVVSRNDNGFIDKYFAMGFHDDMNPDLESSWLLIYCGFFIVPFGFCLAPFLCGLVTSAPTPGGGYILDAILIVLLHFLLGIPMGLIPIVGAFLSLFNVCYWTPVNLINAIDRNSGAPAGGEPPPKKRNKRRRRNRSSDAGAATEGLFAVAPTGEAFAF